MVVTNLFQIYLNIEMTDLLNASSLTPILNDMMGQFDPPTTCQVGVLKPRQPGSHFNNVGYQDRDMPYYGAEVPFLRPSKYSQDTSEDSDVVLHYLNWCRANMHAIPDLIIYLRPTTPLRDPMELSNAILKLQNDSGATSLRSAHELSEPPQKMFKIKY